MGNRKHDAEIAATIMGYEVETDVKELVRLQKYLNENESVIWFRVPHDVDEEKGWIPSNEVPHYTSDVADDYAVLEKVRTWNTVKQEMFVVMLTRLHDMKKKGDFILMYQPGDYARAALTTLREYQDTTI